MKKHVKIYLDAFGYTTDDVILCEICLSKRAVDIHHIENRGMGGNPNSDKDTVQNLQACCRRCHEDYGDVPALVPILQKIHLVHLKRNGIKI